VGGDAWVEEPSCTRLTRDEVGGDAWGKRSREGRPEEETEEDKSQQLPALSVPIIPQQCEALRFPAQQCEALRFPDTRPLMSIQEEAVMRELEFCEARQTWSQERVAQANILESAV
jgi:hypothetical protein